MVSRFNRTDDREDGVRILTEDFVEVGLTTDGSTLSTVITPASGERLILTKATVFVPGGTTPDPATAEIQDSSLGILAKSTTFSAGDTHELYSNPEGTAIDGDLQVLSDNTSAEFTVAGKVKQTF